MAGDDLNGLFYLDGMEPSGAGPSMPPMDAAEALMAAAEAQSEPPSSMEDGDGTMAPAGEAEAARDALDAVDEVSPTHAPPSLGGIQNAVPPPSAAAESAPASEIPVPDSAPSAESAGDGQEPAAPAGRAVGATADASACVDAASSASGETEDATHQGRRGWRAPVPEPDPDGRLRENPRIQRLLDSPVNFPGSAMGNDRGKASAERRRRGFDVRRRITLWSVIAFFPRKFWNFWNSLTLPGLFVAAFVSLVALGTFGLKAIPFLVRGEALSNVDAVFTMTSAASLTGLSAFDIQARLTFWGQAWTLLFIQVGGILFYAFSTMLICAIGRRLSDAGGGEVLASTLFTASAGRNTSQMLRGLVWFTLRVEGVATLVLWPFMVERLSFKDIFLGLWRALFLAVDSFCNCSLFLKADSLQSYARNPFVLLVVTALTVLGGIGYLVLGELSGWWSERRAELKREMESPSSAYRGVGRLRMLGMGRLSLNALAVVASTPVLLVGGALLFLCFEWSGTLAQFGPLDRLVNAWTLSAMSRSTGMSSVDSTQLSNAGIYLSILMMLVGGASGSMAGGLKLTTCAVLVAQAVSKVRGQRYVNLFGRAVPERIVERAGAMALIAFALISAGVFLMGWTEGGQSADIAMARRGFLPLFFETVSALTNTGVSLSFTQTLSQGGKCILVALMFVGRIGMLAFFSAVSLKEKPGESGFRPATENVFLG